MPLLSILLPTYNRAAYLRDCLDSLLATTVDCEIVIADNASPDGTPDLVRSYSDPRIRYHRHAENIGSLANHNFLLAEARGTYVCLFGDDDLALPGCFEAKVALLERSPQIALVYSRAAGIDANGTECTTGSVYGQLSHGYVGGREEFSELLVNCYISWQTLVFRRSVLEEIGDLADGWGLKASIDWFWLQKMVRGRQTAFIVEPTVRLRFHPDSYTSKEAMRGGYFADDRLTIWRHWLIDHPDPPAVSEAMWERMVVVVASDVKDVHGHNTAMTDAHLGWLATLKVAYQRRMNERVKLATRASDPFQPGAPPWPLEGLRGTSFCYLPAWAGLEWREVIRSFATAFGAHDDVTLVLALDPSQGLDEASVAARVIDELAASGATRPPDLLLVPEPADAEAFARLYAAVDVIVAAGDPVAAARARCMGKDVLASLTPDAWRARAPRREAVGP